MRCVPVVLVIASSAVAAAQTPVRVQSLTFSEPATVTTLDMGKLKGEPARLAWSPDGAELYVQTREGAFGQPGAKLRHYVFAAAGGSKRDVDAEPEWASSYWTVKSGQAAPDDASLKIELKSEVRQQRTTAAPMAGDMARGGVTTAPGASAGDATAAAYGSQTATAHVMRLKGVTIGEFVNSAIVPGLTFGWAPKGRAIAFTAQKSGRVTVMDAEGSRQEIEASEDAILPAWSQDGASLAWLQPEGRKKFVLQVARVSTTS
jgi:hypothetical protein